MSLVLFQPYKSTEIINVDYTGTVLLLHMESAADNGPNLLNGSLGGSATFVSGGRFGNTALSMAKAAADGLGFASNKIFNIGASDFTIEYWIRPNDVTLGGQQSIVQFNGASNNNPYVMITGGTMYWRASNAGTPLHPDFAHGMVAGTWYFVSHVKQGDTYTTYIDGVRKSTGSTPGVIANENKSFSVGGKGLTQSCTCLIDEVRLSNTARYTGSTCPVPAAAFPDSSVDPYFAYNSVLLHMDGVDGGNTFNDVMGRTVSVLGSVVTSAQQVKYGTTSAKFTGGRLTLPLGADLVFGLGDFTVEGWFYQTADVSYPVALELGDETNGGLMLITRNAGNATMYSGGWVGSKATALNTWNHIAWVRKAGVFTVYVNGLGDAGTAFNTNLNSATYVTIGGDQHYGGNANYLYPGFIDDFRITKGVARYSGNFIPPSTALTNTAGILLDSYFSNVSTLLHFNSAAGFIDSASTPKVFTPGAGVTVSSGASVSGGSSALFDGSASSTLKATPSADYVVGTGDFTIEGWIYMTAFSATASGIFHLSATNYLGAVTNSLAFATRGSAGWQIYANNINNNSTGSVPALNVWTHFAVVRASGITKLYINGVSVLSITDNVNYSASYLQLGAIQSQAYTLRGSMDEFRFTKGVARYTANFTPTTVAFANA